MYRKIAFYEVLRETTALQLTHSRLNPDQIIVYHDFTIVSRSVFKIKNTEICPSFTKCDRNWVKNEVNLVLSQNKALFGIEFKLKLYRSNNISSYDLPWKIKLEILKISHV